MLSLLKRLVRPLRAVLLAAYSSAITGQTQRRRQTRGLPVAGDIVPPLDPMKRAVCAASQRGAPYSPAVALVLAVLAGPLQGADRPLSPDLYQEKLRPQFHFTARQWTVHKLNPGMREEGWLNDPNGLIYLHGEYHLFAQRWNRCWIHAVSTDLLHWTELQPAFWEDGRFGGGVQSGSAVLDWANVSGLSPTRETPPLIAFWSGNDNRSQCISYSGDQGRTWTKYARNPVLVHPERDPKVFWHAPSKRWVMVLYGKGNYHLFTSRDLLTWTDQKNPIPDCYECPDLFPLPVNGKKDRLKWVLVRGNGRYSVGTFDGCRFQAETEPRDCDLGPNFYATQTWNNTETGDGRRIQIAWMRGGKYPDMPFNQQLTFPCELTLQEKAGCPRLFRKPIREIERLHRRAHRWNERSLSAGASLPLEAAGELFHLLATVEVPRGSLLSLNLRGFRVAITHCSVACGKQTVTLSGPVQTVEVLVDRTSIEVFVNEGEVSLSTCFLPQDDRLTVECSQGKATLRSLQLFELDSIWKKGRIQATR